jgi:signal-transduction protein with cAMP-binding, CBS, and nucleotidyltransferase domain
MIGETPKCHGNIMRKIDNLEKKQEMWRERAQVWDREKRNYQMTLECVFFK